MAAKQVFVDGQRNPQAGDTSTANRSVLVKNLSPSTSKEAIIIYFQRRKNGGGEVDDVRLLSEGVAVVTFDKDEVAESVLKRAHNIDGVQVTVERNVQTSNQVFGKVAGRLNPQSLGLSFSSLEEILQSIKDETGVEWQTIFDGFVVSGTFEQITKVHSLLQKTKPIKTHQRKRETVQTDCKRSVFGDPKAMGQPPQIETNLTKPAIGRKNPSIDSNLTGKANMRDSQGRGLNHRMNMVNSKETYNGGDKSVHLESFIDGSVVPSFEFSGAESTLSRKQKHKSEKSEFQSSDRYQAEDLIATAGSKKKTDEARKLENEFKNSQILGVKEQRSSREGAETFRDPGIPNMMAQSDTRLADIDIKGKHKEGKRLPNNNFQPSTVDKRIDTQGEAPIQDVSFPKNSEETDLETSESYAEKKTIVEDPNNRTDSAGLVTKEVSSDAVGSALRLASFSRGIPIGSKHKNQEETNPFETLPKNAHEENNNGQRIVRENGNPSQDNGRKAVRNRRNEENGMIEAPQRNELCERQTHPLSNSPKSPDENIREPESSTGLTKGNHIKFSTETGITVLLLKGDITSHNVDVLICPANPSLCYQEGLSKEIQEKGGRSVKDDCHRITQGQEMPKFGEAYFTRGGNLPCKAILHAILPRWTDDQEEKKEVQHQIHVCLKYALTLASDQRHRSAAFPPLGQEWNPIPLCVSAKIITRVIAVCSKGADSLHSGVTDFHILCEEDATFGVFAKELKEFSFRDKQGPCFMILESENKAVASQSTRISGSGRKKDDFSSVKRTPVQEKQSAILVPASETDSSPQPVSLNHGTESGIDHQNHDGDDFSRLGRGNERENTFLENEEEAVKNHSNGEKNFIEAPHQKDFFREKAYPQSKSPKSDEQMKEQESSTNLMRNNHTRFSTKTGITVMLLKGDITSHNVDVLICPADPSLCYQEGLSKEIQEKGGQSLKDECQRITQGQNALKIGDAFFTDGGNLPCKVVLHAILPYWSSDKEDKKEVKREIHGCLKHGLTLVSGHRSVAFPPLGQEWNPIPVHASAEVITRVIAAFCRSVGSLHSGVSEFRIVCEDDATFSVFAKELKGLSLPDTQQPYFVEAENKTVPYQSNRRCGSGPKTKESSSLKGNLCMEIKSATLLPVSKTDSALQSALFSHGTESKSSHQTLDETKPCESLPKKQRVDENSRLRNVKEKENTSLGDRGEAVGNTPKDEKSSIEAPQQNEICEEKASPESESPNSDESIEDLKSSSSLMKNGHIKFSTETGITVMLLKGDVTSHDVDVLICPAKPSLCYKEGMSWQIQERGGRPVKDECLMITQGQNTLKYGEVHVTNSGNLPCKALLHAIVPLWTDDNEDKTKLKRQIHACLKTGLLLASGHRHRSVAFPPLGQEWNPIPDHVSAEVITRVVAKFSRGIGPLHSGVTDIHIVCEDDAIFSVFAKELEEFSLPHEQKKHFVTRQKLYKDNEAVANENTETSGNGCIEHESSTPKEIPCQGATFPSSSRSDSVPEKEIETTHMVSPKEKILTSSFAIKPIEGLAAVDNEMTTIEVDDSSQPEEARAFEILGAMSGRRLVQLFEDVSKSISGGKSLKREMGEEIQRDEFELKVNGSHDFGKKHSLQLQQSTAVDPLRGQEELGQHHSQRNRRQKLPALSMGKNTIIRKSSNSSSLHNDGRVLEGFMSPTIEALMNADLHLGDQGLTLLHDDEENATKTEDQEKHEKSYLPDLHDENYSSARSIPRSNDVQNNANMPHNSRGKDENILASNMGLGTPDILETTDKNSSSVGSKYDENGSQTLPEKNVSAETAKVQSARVLCALCQKAVDQITPQNSNTCEEHKFCEDCTQRAFSFSDDFPACTDAHGFINPKRVDITTQRRRSNLDTQDTHPSTSNSIPLVEHLNSAYKSVSPQGNQPPGQIMWKKYAEGLPGFEDYGTFVVTFTFYGGLQSPEHPNPGRSYKGISCVAYFPDTQEGKQLLKLLRKAFDARLVFTVSQTAANESGQVVLDGLELKTTAESYLRNGQPDMDYFARLKGQLEAKGIW